MKTNQTQKNIPSDWQQVKLGDIFEFKNGLNKEKKYFGKGTPIVNYVDVYNGGGLYQKIIKGLVEVSKSEKERFEVKKGDVFFTRTSETLNEIGFSAVALDDFKETVFSGFVLRARPKNSLLFSNFAKYCFKTQYARQEIKEKSSYTTRALTSGSLLNYVKLLLPPLPEQNRIVAVLETWDHAIEKLKRKIEIKKEIKKGLMQELLTGKTRLPGFSNSWASKKLGEVSQILKGTSFTKKHLASGKVPVVAGGRQPAYFHNQANREGKIITVSASGAYAGFVNYFDIPIFASDCSTIQEKTVNINFLYYYLKLRQDWLYNMFQVGGAQPHVYPKDLKMLSLLLPDDRKEQDDIAGVIMVSDREIETLEQKLKIFKDQKKYLLNNLITGKIRTPENLLKKINK